MAFVQAMPLRRHPQATPNHIARQPLRSQASFDPIYAPAPKRVRSRSAPPRPTSVSHNRSPGVHTRLPATDLARRAAADIRHAPQRHQWDALLAAALAEPPVQPDWFRPAVVPASPDVVRRGGKRPVRKPHGFWNDLANVERELLLVNALLGRPGAKIIPRLSEISALGRGDLVAAIGKHGGVKKVAVALRWGRGGKTRRAVSALGAERVIRDGTRDKILRRPKAYWNDIERVQSEIGAFVAEYGETGVMPTQKQFYSFERSDLVQAAGRHGGLRVLAQSMGLRCRRAPKKRMYWKDFDVLKKALLEFADERCPGRMPTGDELVEGGASSVANAIAAHGGFPEVAKKCGLNARNTRSQGAPVTWDEGRLRTELHAFTVAYLPGLAKTRTIPTERELRKFGRNDLSYAINKFGGFAKITKVLGLQQRRRGIFRSNAPIEPVAGADVPGDGVVDSEKYVEVHGNMQ